jgi:hypothetical protein
MKLFSKKVKEYGSINSRVESKTDNAGTAFKPVRTTDDMMCFACIPKHPVNEVADVFGGDFMLFANQQVTVFLTLEQAKKYNASNREQFDIVAVQPRSQSSRTDTSGRLFCNQSHQWVLELQLNHSVKVDTNDLKKVQSKNFCYFL